VSGLSDRLDRAYLTRVTHEKNKLDGLQKLLKSLSYKDVLARGYAVVRDETGQPVRSAAAIASGSALAIELADGTVDAVAMSEGASPAPRKNKPRKQAPPESPEDQGNLF
jgi:exodeoxyribonuclease VII large subunit